MGGGLAVVGWSLAGERVKEERMLLTNDDREVLRQADCLVRSLRERDGEYHAPNVQLIERLVALAHRCWTPADDLHAALEAVLRDWHEVGGLLQPTIDVARQALDFDPPVRKELIYVAGPFRNSSSWEQEQNIRRAEAVGLAVERLGLFALVPHVETRFFGFATLPDQHWLARGLAQLRRCDAVLLVEGWQASAGTADEIRLARALHMPVFRTLDELRFWLTLPPGACCGQAGSHATWCSP